MKEQSNLDILGLETRNIQNPALGALLLWRFAIGYEKESKTRNPVPIPLLYIVLPIILHEETASIIETTKQSSGLRAFSDKFLKSAVSKSDLILSIQDRAIKMRKLTTDSLKQCISSRLIAIDPYKGVAVPLTVTPPRVGIPLPIKAMLKQVEKLGCWCSQPSLYEVSLILKVGF